MKRISLLIRVVSILPWPGTGLSQETPKQRCHDREALDNPSDPSHAVMIQALETRKQTTTSSLAEMADLLDRFDIANSNYRQILNKSTGEITTDVFRKGVFIGLVQDLLEQSRAWLKARGPAIGFKIIVFALILIAFSVIARIARFIVGFALQNSLSNFAAGIMILGYRPYDIDDFLETGTVFGKVLEDPAAPARSLHASDRLGVPTDTRKTAGRA